MKRFILIALVLLLVFSWVSVFAASKVTLRYALWDGNQKPAMEAAIAAFMKANPDIEVKVELTEWNDYWTKITTGVAARTMPDVFWGHLAFFSGLASKGALMDLTPFIKKDKVNLSVYYPGLVNNWSYQGKQFGLAKDWDTICYMYNKDMLTQAGITAPEKWAWNAKDGGSFLQDLKKLTVDANGKNATEEGFDKSKIVRYAIAGNNAGEIQTGWINFIWMNGAPGAGVLDKQYGTKFTMDNPKAIEALQFYFDLTNKYSVAPQTDNSAFAGGPWDLFIAKKVAIYPAGSWMLGAARSSVKFGWDVAPLPAGPSGRISAFNGLAHNIAAKTKNANAAWKLVKWMDGPEGQKIIAGYGSCFPSIQSIVPVYMAASRDKGPAHIQYYFDEAAGKTGEYPMHVKWAQMWDVITRELNAAQSGTTTVKEAVANIKAEVNPLLTSK